MWQILQSGMRMLKKNRQKIHTEWQMSQNPRNRIKEALRWNAKQIYAYKWSSVNLSYRKCVLTDGGGALRSRGQDIGIRLRGEKFQAQLKLNNLLVKANSLQRNMQEIMRIKILWMEYDVTLHAWLVIASADKIIQVVRAKTSLTIQITKPCSDSS